MDRVFEHFLTFSIFVLPAIILHEIAHGWVAKYYGDPTASERGRLTLNPLRHIDPIGTILLPGMLVFAGQPAFGWAKPVPVNVNRLNNPRRDMILVAIAGPTMNIVLAIASALVARIARYQEMQLLFDLAVGGVAINVVLALFNCLPIPPLDGGRVVTGLLPLPLAVKFAQLERFGLFIVFFLLYTHTIDRYLVPILRTVGSWLIG